MFFGGDFYQSFGVFLPAPDPTFLFNGFFDDVDNVLTKTLYSDPTQANARILSFNCVTAVGPYPFKIVIEGTNELYKFVTEEIEIAAASTPVNSVNKYNTLTKMYQKAPYAAPVMQVGFAQGQSQFLATNGATTTHFVKIATDSGATWSVWGFIPTTIKDLTQVAALKAKPSADLYNKSATTPNPVRVDMSFGYLWIETDAGQTQDVTWVVGSKNLVI